MLSIYDTANYFELRPKIAILELCIFLTIFFMTFFFECGSNRAFDKFVRLSCWTNVHAEQRFRSNYWIFSFSIFDRFLTNCAWLFDPIVNSDWSNYCPILIFKNGHAEQRFRAEQMFRLESSSPIGDPIIVRFSCWTNSHAEQMFHVKKCPIFMLNKYTDEQIFRWTNVQMNKCSLDVSNGHNLSLTCQ